MDGLSGKVCYVRVWPSGQHLELRISFKLLLRDGPLENPGGGGRAKYKKIFAQGKIKWKKIHARQLTLKNIHAMA